MSGVDINKYTPRLRQDVRHNDIENGEMYGLAEIKNNVALVGQ